MRNISRRAAPFCERFAAGLGREVDARSAEEAIELVDGGWVGIAGEAGLPGADRGSGLDAGLSVDLEELF